MPFSDHLAAAVAETVANGFAAAFHQWVYEQEVTFWRSRVDAWKTNGECKWHTKPRGDRFFPPESTSRIGRSEFGRVFG